MKLVDLYPSFYCLFVNRGGGHEKMFLRSELTDEPARYRFDLFESKESAMRWIESEQDILALNESWGMHEVYSRMLVKKVSVKDFAVFMEENEKIDSVSFVDNQGVRRLYFREDFDYGFDVFPMPYQRIYPQEPIYIINRQKSLDDKIVLQKDTYFVTYPEVAPPLFAVGSRDWAEELIARKPDQGYYIEETTIEDVYMRANMNEKDPGFFILSREEAPHYLLRRSDLQKIVEGSLEYQ